MARASKDGVSGVPCLWDQSQEKGEEIETRFPSRVTHACIERRKKEAANVLSCLESLSFSRPSILCEAHVMHMRMAFTGIQWLVRLTGNGA